MNAPLWRQIQKQNFTSLVALADFLQLDASQRELLEVRKDFPLNLPRRLAEKIEKSCVQDPIFRQFVPLKEEGRDSKGARDPLGESFVTHTPKYLHKYAGRVLLLVTGSCAMHCRYCFRQHFPYAPLQSGLASELELIHQDKSIKEVILSGGDPLSLDTRSLEELMSELNQIPHLRRIRLHTRFPIGIPERIDEPLLALLEASSKQIWMVLHCNHRRELDGEIFAACKAAQRHGIVLLNQSVLLRGVNDTLAALQDLSESLIDNGILPYYLHQLDRVKGASHFEVDPTLGKALITALAEHLSGYGVPKYVQELSGAPSKTLL